jgi:chromate transporter
VRLREAFSVWPRIAMLSFGSPAVQLAAMYRILVEEKRWMSRDRFLNALNYCLALPGPEAQLLAAYVGWMMHGMLGAALFTLGVIAGVVALIVLAVKGEGIRAVWTLIQTCLILGSVFFSTGFVGEMVAAQRAETRELRARIEEVANGKDSLLEP